MQITTESIRDQIPSYLTKQAKDDLVSALNSFPEQFEYYIDRYPDEILQGDSWFPVEIISFKDGNRKFTKGILLTNSCDISTDNERDFPVNLTFAPMVSLDQYLKLLIKMGLTEQQVKDKVIAIKEQRVTTLFYLPRGAGLAEDYVAILSDVHTIPYESFNAQEKKQKLCTLSQVGFFLFIFKLSVHFCRFHENITRHPTQIDVQAL